MLSKLRLVLSISIFFLSFYISAQGGYWKNATVPPSIQKNLLKQFSIKNASLFTLDEVAFKKQIAAISRSKKTSDIVYFPNTDGEIIGFNVIETPVFSTALAKKYPNIKSYSGIGIKDPEDRIRFSVSHKGVQSMIKSLGANRTIFIEKSSNNVYVVYRSKEHLKKKKTFSCKPAPSISYKNRSNASKLVDDQQLRTYRIAVAASGEYTQYHGGTKTDALAAINATLTRINEVFENDLNASLSLVADTDLVIYTDPDTDPFSGDLSIATQNTLDAVIGEANYDIGHLFNQSNGGLDGFAGFIGGICESGKKGSAYSTFATPKGDLFDIDLVAHELGHQLGANHTFSHEQEGTNVQVEPGSGTTIMGYAGITGANDVAPNSDAYFNVVSIEQMNTRLQFTSCAVTTTLNNTPPSITPIPDYTIPTGTAFLLEATATDVDTSDILTYTWEQVDDGFITQDIFGPSSLNGALFRSLPPSIAPQRYFPLLSRVIDGTLTQTNPTIGAAWETISLIERTINLKATVRDNALGGGQSTTEAVLISVIDTGEIFEVTSQATPVQYEAGDVHEVRWNVANTDISPINTTRVSIYLSVDGGFTYPTILAENVLNNGSYTILVPAIPTTSARLMVKAINNVYYAINSANFTILEAPVILNFDTITPVACATNTVEIDFTYNTYNGFSEQSSFSVRNPIAGINYSFSPSNTTANGTPVTLTLSNLNSLETANYPIQVATTAPSFTKETPLQLAFYKNTLEEVVLVSPENNTTNIISDTALVWESTSQSEQYTVEIATDVNFANIIETASTIDTSYTPKNVAQNTQYFWRVRASNLCDTGNFSEAARFTMAVINCATYTALDTPLIIDEENPATVLSTIRIDKDLPISDIKVSTIIRHSYIGDLSLTLISPQGIRIPLITEACGIARNINVTFSDTSVGVVCDETTPAINGTYKPLNSFNPLLGISVFGEWTLEVVDAYDNDGGTIESFSLEACLEGDVEPDDDGDGIFNTNDVCPNTPAEQEVDTTGCPIYRFSDTQFNISTTNEICERANDGTIVIATETVLNYTATLRYARITTVFNFTESLTIPNVASGDYELCITATENAINYEPFCSTLRVATSEQLSVNTLRTENSNNVMLTMAGTPPFIVVWNNLRSVSTARSRALILKPGINNLSVTTENECQGSYEESFLLGDTPAVYPNPFTDTITLYFGERSGRVVMNIFSANGEFLKNIALFVVDGTVQAPMPQLPAGVYYLAFEGTDFSSATKIIKR